MPLDARLSTTLPSHPKTKKLLRRHGPAAAWSLVCLFLWAAGNRSDGNLSGMSDEDIELAADWLGEPGVFVKLLMDVGFLDGTENAHSIHDWAEHNPWAAGAEDRSVASKWAALCKRYGREKAAEMMPEYATRMRPAQLAHADCTPPAPEPHAPSVRPVSEPHAEPVRSECPTSVSVTVSDTKKEIQPSADAEPASLKEKIFGPCLDFLATAEQKPRDALRSIVGKWCSVHGDGTTLQAIAEAQRNSPLKPIPYVEKILKNAKQLASADAQAPGPARVKDEAFWRENLPFFQRTKIWPNSWGPEPGYGGCEVPKHLIAEFNLDGLTPPNQLNRLAS